MADLLQTPSQTVGPFFHDGLIRAGENILVRPGTRGDRIVITGRVIDGDGVPLPDAVLELWQADAGGIFAHPADPRCVSADPLFRGFGRSDTSHAGQTFRFETIKPGRVPGDGGAAQAPHACLHVFARGLLTHLSTRMYFADEAEANAGDSVLAAIAPVRRSTLFAQPVAAGATPIAYSWDIVLQGEQETVFFEP